MSVHCRYCYIQKKNGNDDTLKFTNERVTQAI